MTIHQFVTTRHGGVSPAPYESLNLGVHVGDAPDLVTENRRRLSLLIRVEPSRIVWMDQVHGTHVEVVRGPVGNALPGTDAVVTDVPGLALAVLTADCVPILLADHAAGIIAAAHAGRKGAEEGIARETVAAMEALGATASAIEAFLGPGACGQCYEVPGTMRAEVSARLPGSASETRWGTPALDLRNGLEEQLVALGVARVRRDPRCTIECADLFSHRRGAPAGRLASVIWQDAAS
ncbi:peptidoglycan editing factor PgeF [Hoyosella sp. G463]|uniref:Purine nucleoside phosphorylase n=1 Tax=Lolliginicoccus lacisalsi TaxID=2742202 RepID=A0A927JEU3_9ACTN|nr:peptidoglycan editing factor PgeF [Lolliginicoccus lacisalsi]MBD8507766.1 peptidoglycan editing factor PgeF [Lolliginicoccus lacisalsi]